MWQVRKAEADRTFTAPDLPTMIAWCRAGRVRADDLVRKGPDGPWQVAGGVAELAGALPGSLTAPPLAGGAVAGETDLAPAERRGSDKFSLDLTSMMDMTFILLIFLMLIATPAFQQGLGVNLPSAAAATAVDRTDLVVSIDEAGAVYLDKELIPVEQLGERLTDAAAGAGFGRLILRADGAVSHREVVKVMDIIHAAGITDITIATKPSKGE